MELNTRLDLEVKSALSIVTRVSQTLHHKAPDLHNENE